VEPKQTYSEAELVISLNKGDNRALEELMHQYYPVLFRFSNRLVMDHALAEDIACEAFIELWKKQQSFTSLPSIRKFLWITARYNCLDALRKQKTRNKYLESVAAETPVIVDALTLNELIRAELLSDIYSAIRSLPEQMQRIFIMSYIDGLKNDEIAQQLQITNKTVRNQKSKALEILRLKFRNTDLMEGLLIFLFLLKK
jgi:RNA polymerase sigma-70 factor (family 1)